MKTPRVDRFDAKHKVKPEPVNFAGVPAIAHQQPPTAPTAFTPAPLDPAVNQPIHQSIHQLINHPRNRLMQKPVGFYITSQLDERLDAAVRYYKEKHGFSKVDRSVVLNALLESGEHWTEQALDLLISRVITVLTRKLTG
jgi:hypothetical protein